MKQLFLTMLFALITIGAFAVDQEPLYIIDGKKATLEDVNNLKNKKIVSMIVRKGSDEVRQYDHMGDVSNGVVCIITEQEGDDIVWAWVEEMPRFMDGDVSTFVMWVMQNVRYPAKAIELGIEGRVVVEFVVDSNGYIDTDTFIFHETGDKDMILRDEVIRVLSKSPQWTPGRQKGKPVRVRFVIPVTFKMPETETPTTPTKESEVTDDAKLKEIVVVSFGE